MIYLSQNEDKLICQFRNRKYMFFFVKLFKHRKMYEKQHNSYLFWKKVTYVSNIISLKVSTGQPVD